MSFPAWSKTLLRTRGLVLGALLFALLAASAYAQISPGKLSRAHEDLEGITNCTKCHDLGQAISGEKCLDCHTAIDGRIKAGEGYHASREVQGESCATCHAEHSGRDYDLIHWESGREAFDHSLAGWEFAGAHSRLECATCHQPRFQETGRFYDDETVNPAFTYLGLDDACLSCHADEHGEQLTDRCADCHGEDAWSPAPGFDHATDSDYALTGKHTELLCDKCHKPESAPPAPENRIDFAGSVGVNTRYGPLAFDECSACHRDVHEGKFGARCSECHNTAGFQQVSSVGEGEFDHEQTDFPLRGLHTDVRCESCHTGGSLTQPMAHGACSDCHADEHRGQFADHEDGGACESCHAVDRPFRRHGFGIQRHQQSEYPLTGSHLAVPCALCHVPVPDPDGIDADYARFEFASTRCQECHDDVHQNQLDIWIDKDGCEFCHSTATWHRTSFDHGLARFPLEGKHREILCLECHWIETDAGEEMVWMKPLEMNCAGCHDDQHGGQFAATAPAKECEACHQPVGWKQLAFDHDRDTNFKLTGGHENVTCVECHVAEPGSEIVRYRGVETACAACHSGARG